MAIIIEENKNKVDGVRLLGWLGIIIVIGAAIYYLFFAAPEAVVISPPANFTEIAPLAQVNLNPEDVLNSAAYTALKAPPFALPTPQGPASVGRPDPFVPVGD
jgi:hypothetical protein